MVGIEFLYLVRKQTPSHDDTHVSGMLFNHLVLHSLALLSTTNNKYPKIINNNNNNMCAQTDDEKKQEQPSVQGVAARLARSNILELQPYRCARDDYSEGILLDANENAYGPPLQPKQQQEQSIEYERYPDPYQIPLKQKLADYRGHGLTPSNIFVGVGSDEAIDLLMRIFCRPGIDAILTTPPTYGMYKVCAKVNDVNMVQVPLTPDFDLRVPEVRYCYDLTR